ncbi:MAG: hypothetical protein P8105_08145 [Dehalococcoidia bacterium]
MNANLIIDRDLQKRLSGDLKDRLIRLFREDGHQVDVFEIGKNEVSHSE